LLGNLSYPLFEPDESRYAQIAQEMIASGDWVTPTLEGRPYLDKPPLLYWLTALSFKAFGAGEMAARLPCAISALLTLFALYALGRRLVGGRAAWCGAVLLLLCGGFMLTGRFLLMDSLLALFTTVAMLCMYEAQRDPRSRVGWWLVSGIACGLGALAKGPIAVVLCVPPLVAARWLDESSRPLRVRHWIAFAVPIFMLAIPWFVAISAVQTEFSGYFFWKHHIVRFFNAFDHRQPWWFYVPVGLAGMFPASLLFPLLARFLFSRSPVERSMRARELGYLVLAAAWILGLFSMSSCKLPSYILPAMPPLCLLLGSMLDVSVLQRGMSNRFSDALQRVPRQAIVAVLAVAVIGAVTDTILVREGGLRLMLDLSIVIGAGWMLLLVSRVPQLQTYAAWAGAAAITIALNVYVFDVSLPGMSRLRSVSLAAARLHESNQSAPVVYFDRISHSASLHLKQDEFFSLRADQLSELADFTRRFPSIVVVTTSDGEATIRRGLGSSIDLKASGPRSGLYLARTGSAPIEVSGKTATNLQRLSKR
jgi:4-amino-4-deoxy-L-arabinose transferase-like glycosyltransferase